MVPTASDPLAVSKGVRGIVHLDGSVCHEVSGGDLGALVLPNRIYASGPSGSGAFGGTVPARAHEGTGPAAHPRLGMHPGGARDLWRSLRDAHGRLCGCRCLQLRHRRTLCGGVVRASTGHGALARATPNSTARSDEAYGEVQLLRPSRRRVHLSATPPRAAGGVPQMHRRWGGLRGELPDPGERSTEVSVALRIARRPNLHRP